MVAFVAKVCKTVFSVPNLNTMLRRLVLSLSGRGETVDKILLGESSPIINGGDARGCLRGVFRVGATMSFGTLRPPFHTCVPYPKIR